MFWAMWESAVWDFDAFFNYGLMGALHAASVVVSLRGPKTVSRVLGFISLAIALSALTPWLGLFGSVVWLPLGDILRENNLGAAEAILVTGSAIGASAYWLLVRQFWIRDLERSSWFWTVGLCTAATSMVVGIHGVRKIESEITSPMLTVAWWFAFSTSLYLSERRQDASTAGSEALV